MPALAGIEVSDGHTPRLIASAAWGLWIALTLTACRPTPSETAARELAVEIGPKYSAKSGLLLPDETRRSIGLKIVAVTEQKIPATVALQLRVYRQDANHILASAKVSIEDAKPLRPGQTVEALAGDTRYSGQVTSVNDQLPKAIGMAEVLVILKRPDGLASVGAFLSGSVALESEATVVSIPRAALIECTDGPAVYTMSGEYLVRTPVKVGARGGELVEIKDGLYAGDEVVSQPVMTLWLTELAAVKGGQSCCVTPPKGK